MVGEKAARPDTDTLRSEATMHTDAQVRRPGGRLSREDQRRIGDILQRVYDEVLREGVPDRFKELLERFEQPSGDAEARSRQGQSAGHHQPDHMVGAKGFDNKGSRS
jgi:Anti-sigma factor NepR